MESKALGERSSYQLMSIASRIKAIHHAMTAGTRRSIEGLEINDSPSAKRGTKLPSFRVGSCVRFDPANISRWLVDMGVKRMSKP